MIRKNRTRENSLGEYWSYNMFMVIFCRNYLLFKGSFSSYFTLFYFSDQNSPDKCLNNKQTNKQNVTQAGLNFLISNDSADSTSQEGGDGSHAPLCLTLNSLNFFFFFYQMKLPLPFCYAALFTTTGVTNKKQLLGILENLVCI